MIRIQFAEPDDDEWQAWLRDARAAAAKIAQAVDGGQEPKFNDALYKRMRQVYYDTFHGKCAYCERKFVLDQSGDIDHFRPKGAVTDENDAVVDIEAGGVAQPHPGYYWLAYEWRNLLPTCARCNRPARLPDGRLVGKSTRFPVARVCPRCRRPAPAGAATDAVCAEHGLVFRHGHEWRPGLETNEAPLFIHPIFDNPELHLRMDVATGLLIGKTPRGQLCIDLLDLNRDGLPDERRKCYRTVGASFLAAASAIGRDDSEASEHLAFINDCKSGKAELSWAGRLAFESLLPSLQKLRNWIPP
jgi:hypothetical protein